MHALIAALLAAHAVAAETALEPAKILSEANVSGLPSSRYLLNSGAGSLAVWDLAGPRQIALIDVPEYESKDEEKNGASSNIIPYEVSPDGRWALASLSVKHWTTLDGYSSGRAKLLLLSIADQRVERVLFDTGFQKCDRALGMMGNCPEIPAASFSPDGTKVAFRVDSDPSAEPTAHWPGSKPGSKDLVHHVRVTYYHSGLDGRTIDKRSSDGTFNEQLQSSVDWLYSPKVAEAGFLPDGAPAWLFADGAGCSVRTPAGKQVSFLEDCTADLNPVFWRGRAISAKGAFIGSKPVPFAVWDLLTGAAQKRAGPLDERGGSLADDALLVAEVAYDTSAVTDRATVTITDPAGARVIARRRLALPSHKYQSYGFNQLRYSAADGRLVFTLTGEDNKILAAVFNLGAGAASEAAAPAAAAPAPAADVDAPPASPTKADPDAYAVVIGVEKYRQAGIPAVDFASRDAETMYGYLTRAMGYDPKNVVLLTDEHASKADLAKYLGRWLENRVDEKSRVFVYYAGHGSPNPATGEGYLMPYEADPAYLDDTAFPIAKLYDNLAKLPTKDVTVILDACFSGQGGRSLIAKGARPLVASKDAKGPGNAVVLAAATGAQISASDPQRRHGLLTSYLLEALHGAADQDTDGKITGAEVYAYVRPAVERAARLQNVEQTPTLSGQPGARPWIQLGKR